MKTQCDICDDKFYLEKTGNCSSCPNGCKDCDAFYKCTDC